MKRMTIYCMMIILLLSIYCGIMHNNSVVDAESGLVVSAKSAILIDYNSGSIIFEKDKDKKLPIASMVKLMTIYIAFENIENGTITYDTKVHTSENASGMGGSQVFIDPFVEYKLEDLLKSVIMASANDASVAIAELISGSESLFVDEMNNKAKTLGMNNTIYANCTGLPAPEQFSTAYDCAILIKNLLKFNDYHKFSTIWMDELVHPSGRKTELVNTNKLIRYFDGCDSGKTGSTSEAGFCLTSSAKRNNMRLISVVIGAKTSKERFKDSTSLYNFGFTNFENKKILDNMVVLKEVPTTKSKEKIAQIISKEEFYAFDKKGAKSNYEVNYELPDFISNTKVGEVVGKAIISKEGKIIKSIELTVKYDINPLTFADSFKTIISNMY